MTQLPTFVCAESFSAGETVTLGEDAAHHIRVRRLESGHRVGLLDGRGTRGAGVLVRVAKRHAAVQVDDVQFTEAPLPVHLLLPIADRERMLWLAEKATELGVTSWRPVLWKRSRSVVPRGEGSTFQQKVAARMHGALEQSGGTWLPMLFPDATIERAVSAAPPGVRLVLDAAADPLLSVVRAGALGASASVGALDASNATGDAPPACTIAVGPEGGFEEDEIEELVQGGFVRAALGDRTLRFETAAVAAVAIVRAALESMRDGVPNQRVIHE